MSLAPIQRVVCISVASCLITRSHFELRHFWLLLVVLPKTPLTVPVKSTAASAHSLCLDFRVCGRSSPAGVPKNTSDLPWDFFPSRDFSSTDLPNDECSAHLRSALSVSRALSGLRPVEPCGLISSHCHVLGFPFRGFPYCQAAPSHRGSVPSCALAMRAYPSPK
jgi:hypothetical protein